MTDILGTANRPVPLLNVEPVVDGLRVTVAIDWDAALPLAALELPLADACLSLIQAVFVPSETVKLPE